MKPVTVRWVEIKSSLPQFVSPARLTVLQENDRCIASIAQPNELGGFVSLGWKEDCIVRNNADRIA